MLAQRSTKRVGADRRPRKGIDAATVRSSAGPRDQTSSATGPGQQRARRRLSSDGTEGRARRRPAAHRGSPRRGPYGHWSARAPPPCRAHGVQQQVDQQQGAVNKQQELIKSLQRKTATGGRAGGAGCRANPPPRRAAPASTCSSRRSPPQAVGGHRQPDRGRALQARAAEHDLKLSQARTRRSTTAIGQFKKVGEQIETGWKGVEARATSRPASPAIVSGSDESQATTYIAQKAKALTETRREQEKYATLREPDRGMANYQAAAAAADQAAFRSQPARAGLPSGNQ